MTLALMESIIQKQYLSAEHCAQSYGKHYLARPSRGYGKSAATILKSLGTNCTSHLQSGFLVTNDGSWANGGAMRIAPIGLCFRNASKDILLMVKILFMFTIFFNNFEIIICRLQKLL